MDILAALLKSINMNVCKITLFIRDKFLLLIALAAGTLLIVSPVSAQLSPGDLSKPHSDLEGLTNCTNCHELGKGPSNKKCLDCHSALQRTLDAEHGYHFQIINTEEKKCVNCHRDHVGKEFSLITWPISLEKFDHSLTGYQLEGGHAKVPCRDCHNPVLQQDTQMNKESSVDVTVTFLGLNGNCLSCHLDEHREQLGQDCQKCHVKKGFKPAEKFDHANARFTLTGKHKTTDCIKCHPVIFTNSAAHKADTSYCKYVGIAFNNCLECHKDKHNGKFGLKCNKCHNTTGWKNIITANFDHSKADFDLRGKHTRVACEKCHKNNTYLEKLAFDICTRCHQDSHDAQFVRREDKGMCESCHNVKGFRPALFTIEDHRKTRFELVGAHLAQPCVICHKKPETKTYAVSRIFTFEDRTCQSCHDDPHRGQFNSSKPFKDCTTCHNSDRWELPDFDHQKITGFKLESAHTRIKCSECHKNSIKDQPEVVRYRNTKDQCKDCHVNPEQLSALVEGTI